MTREEAKKIALEMIDAEITKHGEDGIFMQSPKFGKSSWTNREAKESILEDRPLEDSCGHNIIDSVLEYCKYIGDKLWKII